MFRIAPGPENRRVELQIKNIASLTETGIRQAFYKVGKDLRGTAKRSILAKPRSGRVYRIRRGGRIVRHVASRPGEAPASFTGTLWRSLDFKVRGADSLEFGYRSHLSPDVKKTIKGVFYGKFLELGTDRIKPRPGLKLAIKENERNAVKHFEAEIKKSVKKGSN